MKSLCNSRVSGWNPDTLKEIVRFVHEVHPVFAVTLSTFLHMLCGWNDDTMPTSNLFRVHLKCFSISGSYSSKNSVNAWKITNEDRKGWKLMMFLWMVYFEHRKTISRRPSGLRKTTLETNSLAHSTTWLGTALKMTSGVRMGWGMMVWLWMVHFEHTKSQEFK